MEEAGGGVKTTERFHGMQKHRETLQRNTSTKLSLWLIIAVLEGLHIKYKEPLNGQNMGPQTWSKACVQHRRMSVYFCIFILV